MRIVYLAPAAASALALLSATGPAFGADWKLVEANGVVRIAAPGRAPAAGAANQVVPVGSIVTTAAGGRAALFNGAQRVTLGPNSRMTIAPEQASGVTRIMQDLGSVLFQVDKKPAQHFRVETPLLAAIVKGTTFTVNVDVTRDSVHVAEGLVEVRANQGGAARDVGAGATGVIAREAPAQLNVSAPSAALEPTVEPLQLGALDYTAVSGGLVDGPGTAASPVTPAILSRSGDAGSAQGAAGPAGTPGQAQAVVLAANLQPPATPPSIGGVGGPPATGNSGGNGNAGGNGAAGGNRNGDAGSAGNGADGANGNGNAGGNGSSNPGSNGNAGSAGNGVGGANGNGAAGGNGSSNPGSNGNAGSAGNGVGGANGNGAASGNGNGNAGSNGNAGGDGNGSAGGNGNAGSNDNGGGNPDAGSGGSAGGNGNENAGGAGNGGGGSNGGTGGNGSSNGKPPK